MKIRDLWVSLLLVGCEEERKCKPQDRVVTDPDEVLALGWEVGSRKPTVWLTLREAALQSGRREVCLELPETPRDDSSRTRVHLEVPFIEVPDIEAHWRLYCGGDGQYGDRYLTLDYVWGILRSDQRRSGAVAVQGKVGIGVYEGATRGRFEATLGCDVWGAPSCQDSDDTLTVSVHLWDYEADALSSYWYREDIISSARAYDDESTVLSADDCVDLVAGAPFDAASLGR